MKYLSVDGEYESLKVIEKSKFITHSAHVESEEEARAFIQKISKRYSDATHNCYAFICDTLGNLLRFSDDGEPQGTAGMPMLEVLKAKNLRQTAVVVTRYFGGIKLGAGGLVRAYSSSVAENLAAAKMVEYQPCVKSLYIVGYSFVDVVMRYIGSRNCTLISTDYGQEVSFYIAIRCEDELSFNSDLVNLLNGKINVIREEEYMFPFPI